MLFPYVVAIFVVAGLSAAHPRRNITGSSPVKITYLHPDYTSSPSPTATPTEASKDSGLSKRDPPDWPDVVTGVVSEGGDVVDNIFSWIFGDDKTKFVTTTAPGTLTTVTLTGGPETPTGPITVTATAPGSLTTVTLTGGPETPTGFITVTATIPQGTVTSTLYTVPAPTETQSVPVHVPRPGQPGCHYYPHPDADGRIVEGGCHNPFPPAH